MTRSLPMLMASTVAVMAGAADITISGAACAPLQVGTGGTVSVIGSARPAITQTAGAIQIRSGLPFGVPVSPPPPSIPTVDLQAGNAQRPGNDGSGGNPGSFIIRLSSPLPVDLTLPYTVSGTAIPGTDYVPLSGTLSIPAGQTQGVVTVYPSTRSIATAVNVVVTMTGVTGVGIPSPSASLTILPAPRTVIDPAVPPASISLLAGKRRLSKNQSATLPLVLTAPRPKTISVTLTVLGPAIPGQDFVLGRAIFAPGSVTAKASLQLIRQAPITDGVMHLRVALAGVEGDSGDITLASDTIDIDIHDTQGSGMPLSLWHPTTVPDDGWEVGATYPLMALNGQQGYRFSASGAALVRPLDPMQMAYDVDGDGRVDTGRPCDITPTAPGPLSVSVTDATGTTKTVTVTVNRPGTVAPRPPAANVALSPRQETVWTTLVPTTVDGVSELLAALTRLGGRTAQAWCFDSDAGTWVQLPTQPTGGLTPGMGVYLATRENLGLTLGGSAPNQAPAISLRPGWNFVGIPAFSDKGAAKASVTLGELVVRDEDGTVLGRADAADSLIGQPYLWNGKGFSTVTVLEVGRGYCIKNTSDEPPRKLTLAYQPGAGLAVMHTTAYNPLRVATREVGEPPAPQSGLATASPTSASTNGNGCGLGSMAALVIGTLAILRFRRR